MEPDIRFIEGSFQKVTVGPDDVIVVKCDQRPSDSMGHHMRMRLKEAFPGCRTIILGPGMDIGAIGPPVESDAVL